MKRTTFVLGAGASQPYGFPTSKALTQAITDELLSINRLDVIADVERQTQMSFTLFQEMAKHLEASNVFTLDEWLSRNSQYLEAGKLCIARRIATAENHMPIRMIDDNWYSELWNNFYLPHCATIEDVSNVPISFVTFNYDRSLEYYLFQMLKSTFAGAEEKTVVSIMQSIPILHVHGQVGFLKWQKRDPNDLVRGYSPQTLWEHAAKSMRHINVISDLKDECQAYKEARELLVKAENIYFLGFGYHTENMRRLAHPSLVKHQKTDQLRVYGSAYLLAKQQLDAMNAGDNPMSLKIEMAASNLKLVEFFRYHVSTK